ncbi:MAG: hypothetical protein KDD19_07865 [Phaeodactylibacter sp.]|nr:hypothetical protein [Phaeodactylibacter sp.]
MELKRLQLCGKDNTFWKALHLFIPPHNFTHKEATKKETGLSGPLFYPWIISINTALLAFIMTILLEVL